MTSDAQLLAASVLFACGLAMYARNRQATPLPPGPPRMPLLGNLLQMPQDNAWLKYMEWGQTYGDIVYLKALTREMLVINSAEAAYEILDKSAGLTSDRPQNVMISLIGWGTNIGHLHYGDEWRLARRAFHQEFNPGAVPSHYPAVVPCINKLLVQFLREPNNFMEHIRQCVSAMSINICYGFDAESKNGQDLMEATEGAIHCLEEATLPGSQLVFLFPPLRFLPSWLSAASSTFSRLAARSNAFVKVMRDLPFNIVKQQIANGTAPPSWMRSLLDRATSTEDEVRFKGVASQFFAAASDTTLAGMRALMLELVRYPEVQRRAQAEIDAVVGPERLPNFGDRPSLPYLDAVIKETLRMHPPLPIGLPHSPVQDMIYNGYLIPKGVTILPNIWAMCYDEHTFGDPNVFRPERFLEGDLRNWHSIAFGFGRRVCVGRYLAEAILWQALASILATFDIKKTTKDGKEVDVPGTYGGILVLRADDFECTIVPRSASAVDLIEGARTED
ncbi:cytochrome P450 [Schizophyllum amplum]|uniref:Cytochrome P450 n=1 Tax=Schizophyllum amplum TaxID=97359 RepID=A0A550BXJ9_9AGAR|nr:cytochrome P450 [Auriculariopsis ampla]